MDDFLKSTPACESDHPKIRELAGNITNRSICEEHGFPLVEFDGYNDAIFPPTNAQGQPFVEYVNSHGTFADVPLEPMLQAWVDCYGQDRVESWKQSFYQERS